MQGNGGTVASRNATKAAVQTVMSGPASGVIAAAFTATAAGFANVITYDMGGTSTDVALIEGGARSSRLSSSLNMRCRCACPWSTCTRSAPGEARSRVSMRRGCSRSAAGAGATPAPFVLAAAVANDDHRREPGARAAEPERLTGVEQHVSVQHVRRANSGNHRPAARLDAIAAAAAILRIANDKWRARCVSCRYRAAAIRATLRFSPSAAPARCTPPSSPHARHPEGHHSGASRHDERAWLRRC